MADDNILAALSGFSQGLSSTLVPMMQDRYRSRLEMERASREREMRKITPPEGLAGDLGIPSLPTDPEVLSAASSLAGKQVQKTERRKMLVPQSEYIKLFKSGKVDPSIDYQTFDDRDKDRPAGGLSKGQEAVDKKFAEDYAEFAISGGYADVQKQLNQLRGVAKELKKTDAASGPVLGIIPKFGRDIVSPEGAALQDTVEEVVQRNLRTVLGAQFTEKEGSRLIERAYNPRQGEAENRKRVLRLISQIDQAAKAKAEAGAYFEENGTLKGFKGKLYRSANDFLSDEDIGEDEIEAVRGRLLNKSTSGGLGTPSLGGDQNQELLRNSIRQKLKLGGRK